MAASINASTSAGVVTTADTSGNLNLQSNGTTIVALTSAGEAVTGTLSASGAATLSSTLGVTGATTLSSTLAAGNTTITGTLSSTGVAIFGPAGIASPGTVNNVNQVSYGGTDGKWVLGVVNTAASGTARGLSVYYTAITPNDAGNQFFFCADPTAARIIGLSNGGISNYSQNNTGLSDVREKKNVELAGNYLDKICAIPVKTFLFNDQTDSELNLGVIAQDVETVAPELVTESNWGTEEAPKIRKTIYETDLKYALMKAIQELAAKVAALEAK
jgi:hypothetical protein